MSLRTEATNLLKQFPEDVCLCLCSLGTNVWLLSVPRSGDRGCWKADNKRSSTREAFAPGGLGQPRAQAAELPHQANKNIGKPN